MDAPPPSSPAPSPAHPRATTPAAPPARTRPLLRALQLLLFLACVVLLVHFIRAALNNERNATQLRALAAASWPALLAMLALSGLTIANTGLVFRALFAPIRPLSRLDLVAVNSVCSLLSYIPFKASLAYRVYTHHRRDRIDLITIGAWLAATAAVMLATLAVPVAASWWRARIDALWWLAAVGGTALAALALVALGRAVRRVAPAQPGTPTILSRLLCGAAMLASPRAVFSAVTLRALDLAVTAARFALAAAICGVALPLDQAVLAAATYFFFQATAPAGVAGVREGGTAALMNFLGRDDLAVVILTVSIAEGAMNIAMGVTGWAWLRRPPRNNPPCPPSSSTAPSSTAPTSPR